MVVVVIIIEGIGSILSRAEYIATKGHIIPVISQVAKYGGHNVDLLGDRLASLREAVVGFEEDHRHSVKSPGSMPFRKVNVGRTVGGRDGKQSILVPWDVR